MTEVGHLILIVEDDRTIAKFLADLVRSRGDRPRVEHDVVSAMKALGETPPCACLFDYQLPWEEGLAPLAISGDRLVKAARAQNPRRVGESVSHEMPIVLVTSHASDPDQIIKMTELGISSFIHKSGPRPLAENVLEKLAVGLERAQRSSHSACRRTEAPKEGAIRLRLEGVRKGERNILLIDGEPRTLTDAPFRILLHLVAARERQGEQMISRSEMGARTSRNYVSRARSAFDGIAPEGLDVVENHRGGGFRLGLGVVVEHVAWDVLARHPDPGIAKLAKGMRGR